MGHLCTCEASGIDLKHFIGAALAIILVAFIEILRNNVCWPLSAYREDMPV